MARNTRTGYPLKWFQDQSAVRRSFECAVCLEVLKDPIQVRECGHQFCTFCIDEVLRNDPRCPSCRIKLSDDTDSCNVFEDFAAGRLISRLEVNCCNEGCDWQGCLSALLQEHQDTCSFLPENGMNKIDQVTVKVLEGKVANLIKKISTIEKKHEEDIKKIEHDLKLKYEEDIKKIQQDFQLKYDKELGPLRQEIKSINQRLQNHQEPQATYIWKIPNVTRNLERAFYEYDYGQFESEPFVSSHGYKMKLRVHLNEALSGFASYMGVYLCLLKSERDECLTWPFTKRFKFVLIDQQDYVPERQDIHYTIIPAGQVAFRRPSWGENESWGAPDFVQHSTLRTRLYVRDHAMYIKLFVYP